jgi:hypothetical protein
MKLSLKINKKKVTSATVCSMIYAVICLLFYTNLLWKKPEIAEWICGLFVIIIIIPISIPFYLLNVLGILPKAIVLDFPFILIIGIIQFFIMGYFYRYFFPDRYPNE